MLHIYIYIYIYIYAIGLRGLRIHGITSEFSLSEAIEVILLHTRDVARLFSYKRIKSQSLYLYLHKNGIATDRSASKTQLMVAVQTFWVSDKLNYKLVFLYCW